MSANIQLEVYDLVKVNKEFKCDNCGELFECDYKVIKWYPAKSMAYFCSEDCQIEVREKDLIQEQIEDRPFWLYVLELADGHYYIGMTLHIKDRIKQHFSGAGAKWSRLHPPVKVIYKQKTEVFDYPSIRKKEDELTILYARLHGTDKVRGGEYCHIDQSWKDFTAHN